MQSKELEVITSSSLVPELEDDPHRMVVGFLFRKANTQVALIRKRKPEFQAGKLNGIGGRCKLGEDPMSALVREFAEETTVTIFPENWRQYCTYICGPYTIYFYVATCGDTIAGDLHNPDEREPVGWFFREGMFRPTNMLSNLHWLIPLALDKDRCQATIHDPSGEQTNL